MTDTTDNKGGEQAMAAAEAVVAARPTAAERADHIAASKQFAADEREAAAKPADISAAKVGQMEASGAFIEDGAKKLIDVSHPAVDNNPRAGTTERQNSVDFNDPGLYDDEAVSQNLANG